MEQCTKLMGLMIVVLVSSAIGCGRVTEQPADQPAEQPAKDQLDILHPLQFGTRSGHSVVVNSSERIVEVPFVHRNLPYPFRGRVLDVGCRESEIPYQLACLGFEAWGIDIRPPLVDFPGLRYVQGDICRYPFETEFFDVVIVLSTIEHIGLGAYGSTSSDPEGDLHALQAIHRILKSKGRLILTVPFGIRGATDWYRVYDHASLTSLLSRSGFTIETNDYWYKNGVRWLPASWTQAERIDSVSHHVQAVACVVTRRAPSEAKHLPSHLGSDLTK